MEAMMIVMIKIPIISPMVTHGQFSARLSHFTYHRWNDGQILFWNLCIHFEKINFSRRTKTYMNKVKYPRAMFPERKNINATAKKMMSITLSIFVKIGRAY